MLIQYLTVTFQNRGLMKNLKYILIPLSSYPISDGHLSDLGFGEARTITFSSTALSKLTSPTMEQQSQGSSLELTKYNTHPIYALPILTPTLFHLMLKFLSKSTIIALIKKLFAALLTWSSGEMGTN